MIKVILTMFEDNLLGLTRLCTEIFIMISEQYQTEFRGMEMESRMYVAREVLPTMKKLIESCLEKACHMDKLRKEQERTVQLL